MKTTAAFPGGILAILFPVWYVYYMKLKNKSIPLMGVILLALEALVFVFLVAGWLMGGVRLGTLPLGLLGMLAVDGAYFLWIRARERAGAQAWKQQRRILLVLLFAVLVASAPLFTDYLPYGHDLEFHLMRIEGIADGLRDGQFPVRIHPDTADGYGYAVSVFYPDLLLYFPAALRLMGLSVMAAYKIFCLLLNALTAYLAYYALSRIFHSERLGAVGAFAYTVALYRLVNLYTRAAVGEATAMAFLPLVAYGIYHILTGDLAVVRKTGGFLPLALGMTGLIYTHLLSCEIAAPLLLLTCLVCIRRFIREPQRLIALLKAAGTSLLLSLGFFVPMLDYSLSGRYQVFSWSVYDRTPDAVNLAQLFPLLPSGGGESNPGQAGIPGEMALGVGFAFLLIIFLFWGLYGSCQKREGLAEPDRGEAGLGLFCVIMGMVCLWMSTNLFPWNLLYQGGGAAAALANMLQFPWRLLAPATLLLIFVFCRSIRMLASLHTETIAKAAAAVVMGVMLFTCGAYTDAMLRQADVFYAYTSEDIDQTRGIGDGEYLPVGFSRLDGDVPHAVGCTVEDFNLEGTKGTLTVRNNADTEGYVDLPRTSYPGYRIAGQEVTLTQSPEGLIRILVPAGYAGTLELSFHDKPLWRAAQIVSLATLAGIIAYGLIARKRRTIPV
jgi:hypothetical protein